jgi:hypothetical protein
MMQIAMHYAGPIRASRLNPITLTWLAEIGPASVGITFA